MIQVDMHSDNGPKLQIGGDYKTLVYEATRVLSTIMVSFGFADAGEDATNLMLGTIVAIAKDLIPKTQEDIANNGTVLVAPKGIINKIENNLEE